MEEIIQQTFNNKAQEFLTGAGGNIKVGMKLARDLSPPTDLYSMSYC